MLSRDREFWYACDIIKEFRSDPGFITAEFRGVLIDDERNRNILGGFGGGLKLWLLCAFPVSVSISDTSAIGMLPFSRSDLSLSSSFCF